MRGATHLTFTQAKAIDVMWQLFVGAGGRFVMAWVAYKIFMDGLTRQLERTSVSYRVYASMTFDTNSLFSVWYALTAVYYFRGWRSKIFLAWFCLSTVYILGFPTLISATAGYLTPSIAGFKWTDNTFFTSDSSHLTSCFDISGVALIGLQNGTIVQGPPEIQQTYPMFYALLNLTIHHPPILYDATNTTRPYFSNDYAQIDHTDLNFTTNFTLDGQFYLFHNYDFFRYSETSSPGITSSYCYNNETFSQGFLEAAAECLPDNYFVWGFSSLLVYIVICLHIIWTLGTYLVWLDANVYSALCRSGRKIRGQYRAAIDLSEAMGEALGKETCAYSDAELSRELQRQPGIRYYSTDAQSGDVSHIGLSSRRVGGIEFNSTKLYGMHTDDQ
ncbi:hypothetical protein N7G274_000615 [Stereocaulon virgatum]|uniref:Uncharacterized protein n=1 Tax=Stereocaulon virgatum TaxID=373712 RepID=A0ABR4APW5_9LECA